VRKEWVIKAARAGKHVLCEKPCACSVADLEEMLDVCRTAGVQFMDGVMFMHSDRLATLGGVLRDGQTVGQVKRIATQFSFRAPDAFLHDNIRTHSALEPLGALGDLGWYNLRVALWVMDEVMPTSVSGRILSEMGQAGSPHSVPTEFSGELGWDSGVSASFYCSFVTELQQWVHVSGTQGSVEVKDFVLPFVGNEVAFTTSNPTFDVRGCRFNMERHERRIAVPEYASNHETAQETKLFRTFSELVLSGTPDPFWPETALKTQRVLEACLASARGI
jgi:predicted dehydrogenase